MGIPPTGKRFEISGQIFHRIEDGKIIESWPLRDDLGMMQQIGVVSMPEPEMA
jgi:predicted ester cyclase